MDKQHLEEIQKRMASVSPGPWFSNQHGEVKDGFAWLICTTNLKQEDAEFIANAPTDMTALIGEVYALTQRAEAAEAEVERLRAALVQGEEFIGAIISFYGQNLTVANWHQNGDHEPLDNFIDDNGGRDALDAVQKALGEVQHDDNA